VNDEHPTLYDELDQEFFLFLWRVKDGAARLFRPLGLRPEQAFILEMVARGIAHPKELAEAMQLDPSLLSHYLAKVEDAGWIERELDPEDRRRTRLKLTGEGQRLLEAAHEAWRAYTVRVLSEFEPDEIETLRAFLKKIMRAQEAQT